MLTQGVPARVVMQTLGHSQIGITLNTYSHVSPELSRSAADRMQALLGEDLAGVLAAAVAPIRSRSALQLHRRSAKSPLTWVMVEPPPRIELGTYALRVRCSAI